jgi:hypothetical protein
MFGRMAFMAGALLLLITWAAPAVLADQEIQLNDQYQMAGKNIIVHLYVINISDNPMGNIYAPDYPNTKWVRLVYGFENFGDAREKGFIQPTFIDSEGSRYQNFDYTGENVLPHTTAGPFFVEIPVPKTVTITKLIFVEGFNQYEFDIPRVATTPTPEPSATPGPNASATPGGFNWRDCLPLIPFAMAGGIAGVGIVINRCGLNKR